MTQTAPRNPMRLCEACIQFDDHPRITIYVTSEGPLGTHDGAEVAQAYELLAPHLPDMKALHEALAKCENAAEQEAVIDKLPAAEADAARAWATFLNDQITDLHLDCFQALESHVKPIGVGPSDHALEGVAKGLQGENLFAHLRSDPAKAEVY